MIVGLATDWGYLKGSCPSTAQVVSAKARCFVRASALTTPWRQGLFDNVQPRHRGWTSTVFYRVFVAVFWCPKVGWQLRTLISFPSVHHGSNLEQEAKKIKLSGWDHRQDAIGGNNTEVKRDRKRERDIERERESLRWMRDEIEQPGSVQEIPHTAWLMTQLPRNQAVQ
jgi:hypothetical protein